MSAAFAGCLRAACVSKRQLGASRRVAGTCDAGDRVGVPRGAGGVVAPSWMSRGATWWAKRGPGRRRRREVGAAPGVVMDLFSGSAASGGGPYYWVAVAGFCGVEVDAGLD